MVEHVFTCSRCGYGSDQEYEFNYVRSFVPGGNYWICCYCAGPEFVEDGDGIVFEAVEV